MRALITFALANEFAPWRKLRSFRSSTIGKADAYVTEISGAEVYVVLTGAGANNAGHAVSGFLGGESDDLSFCVSAGSAGALRPDYKIAQVLAARAVRSETPEAAVPTSELQSSDSLVAFAAEYGATAVDRFYTASRVVGRVEEKRHLGETSDAVEMESFEILKQARAFGVPAIAIRAISDAADEELPFDMNRIFSDEGEVSIPGVVAEVARHPQSIPGLVRLSQQSKQASEALAQFLDRYIVGVVERSRNLRTSAAVAP
jgi:adenosylhomocysteine nucleosidase